MSKKITILTSRQNFVWTSMQEIITWIEEIWIKWSISRSVEYKWINVDETSFKDIAKECLHSDKIIVTCFNLKIASVLSGVRGKLSINTPWIFYLHGLASFGCWPLYRWNVGELLNSNDIFIGSCKRDLSQVRVVFPEIKTFIIPFSLPLPIKISAKVKAQIKKFAFIGRISSQKNLHAILTAASLLKDNYELHFFGKEDFYGSPLMGRRDENYLNFLKELTERYSITDKVFFHGFMDRMDIESMMNSEEWTFIAPSMHSDENFGMAAFRCLLNGHRAILSDWGGHADYPEHFPEQVDLLKVYHSPIGPWISINELSEAMSKPLSVFESFPPPTYYAEESIHKTFDEVLSFNQNNTSPIQVNPILETLLSRREKYLLDSSSPDGSRLYEDYSDPLKDPFFNAYAGGEWKKNEDFNKTLVPWVETSSLTIIINDPHRGHFKREKSANLLQQSGLSYQIKTKRK